MINNAPVELGDDDTPPGTACFRNTLSAGDRNALALAFFLAQLDQDPNLHDRIVVFDDPISSFDDHRRTATQQIICHLANRAAQVIVMSHSALFLRDLWDHGGNPPRRCLKIGRSATGSTIEPWDVESEVATQYHKLYLTLRDYRDSNAGAVREVATAIRPLLEGYLRVTYPEGLHPGEWLGDFFTRTRAAAEQDSPILSNDDFRVL